MIINRQHAGWAALVILATVLASLLYVGEFHPDRLPFRLALPSFLHRDVRETGRSVGGTPLGLLYGGAAAAIFLFAALLGVRRRRPTLKVGRLQLWLKAHIWLTILTIPLVLLHCGFSTGSPMTQWFLALYALVMLSGFYGLALQQFLPRLMKDQLPDETIFEQIPLLRARLHERALELRQQTVAAGVETTTDSSRQLLGQFLDRAALPYLAARRGERLLLGPQRVSDDQFRFLKISLSDGLKPLAGQLQSWCDERRQLDRQARFQHWLHGWLLVHIPSSVLLLLFTVWHALAALFFY